MPIDLAVVVSSDGQDCVVRAVGSSERIQAVASKLIQELWILLEPGDLVTVGCDHDPPEVVYRWWHTTVVELTGNHIRIDPVPSGLQNFPFVSRPEREECSPAVGDRVFCSREHVIDLEVDGEPVHPEWFAEAYDSVRELVSGADARLHMPAQDPAIDEALVRRLLQAQFPEWADLRIQKIEAWENATFRLGNDLCARLTRGRWALGQLEKEHEWLPKLAPHLPLPIPLPLVMGVPGEGYPWTWSVRTWVEGERADAARIDDQLQFASDLAEFLRALHAIDATFGAVAGEPRHLSGWMPLEHHDARMRETISWQRDESRTRLFTRIWDEGLNAPEWQGPPVVLHGDLLPGNLLVLDGRLSGVIDFGVMSIGDPADDLHYAWHVFTPDAREEFRRTLCVDDATWKRARARALYQGAYDQLIADDAAT